MVATLLSCGSSRLDPLPLIALIALVLLPFCTLYDSVGDDEIPTLFLDSQA
jgi:hypothetical protein